MVYKSQSFSEEKFWQTNEWAKKKFGPNIVTCSIGFFGFAISAWLTSKFIGVDEANDFVIAFIIGLVGVFSSWALAWIFHFLFLSGGKIWAENQAKISKLNPENPILPINLKIRKWGTVSALYEEKERFAYNDFHTEAIITHTFAAKTSINTEIRERVYEHSGARERIFKGKPIELSVTESEPFDLFTTTVGFPKSSHPQMIKTGNKWSHRFICGVASDLNDEICNHPVASNLFYEFDFTFFLDGYRPLKKTYYLSQGGSLVESKPEIWPDVSITHYCDICEVEHISIPNSPTAPPSGCIKSMMKERK